jgi:hypothetical protein
MMPYSYCSTNNFDRSSYQAVNHIFTVEKLSFDYSYHVALSIDDTKLCPATVLFIVDICIDRMKHIAPF